MKIAIKVSDKPETSAAPMCWRPIYGSGNNSNLRLTTRDIAARLGVIPTTVCRMVRRGELPTPIKSGRNLTFNGFRTEQALASLKRRRAAAAAKRERVKRMTTAEIAERLGVTPSAILSMAARGELPRPKKISGLGNSQTFDHRQVEQAIKLILSKRAGVGRTKQRAGGGTQGAL